MWQMIEVSVGAARHRGRYRVEGERLVLEWSGGRNSEWCGQFRPELIARDRLRRLAARGAVAA